jgi:phage FluMu protein Com
VVSAALVDVRCGFCSKLQIKMDPDALKDGRRIQWKCERCNKFGERIGQTDQKPSEAQRHQATTPSQEH